MKRSSALIIIGGLVALAPFSGLPHVWLALGLPALGLIIGLIGYHLRPRPERTSVENETAAV